MVLLDGLNDFLNAKYEEAVKVAEAGSSASVEGSDTSLDVVHKSTSNVNLNLLDNVAKFEFVVESNEGVGEDFNSMLISLDGFVVSKNLHTLIEDKANTVTITYSDSFVNVVN